MIIINVDSDGAERELLSLELKGNDISKILGIAAQEIKKNTKENIELGRNADGSAMQAKKKDNGWAILRSSKDNLLNDTQDDKNYQIENHELNVFTSVNRVSTKYPSGFFYGDRHNWGRNIDQRQFTGDSKQLEQSINSRVLELFSE